MRTTTPKLSNATLLMLYTEDIFRATCPEPSRVQMQAQKERRNYYSRILVESSPKTPSRDTPPPPQKISNIKVGTTDSQQTRC